ncbi:hypothetical protein BC936DRAFT_138654 [Jimgerdemannia flammicorona]|uniref:Uncharacterized protein n=1 Tax=Jimgerdemannia flammicorona TaxID=994334 RepID=A0A433BVL6_9FUNG|nr:hypothetical protein BC936DRAFT_138654 [Jimgerdemannia flammicorona]
MAPCGAPNVPSHLCCPGRSAARCARVFTEAGGLGYDIRNPGLPGRGLRAVPGKVADIWLRLWYQRNYQDLPFLAPPTPQLPTASLAPDPSDPWTHPSFPTFASLRQHEIAAHIPLALRVGLPLYSGPSAGGESAVDVGGPPPPPPPPPPPQYHTAVVLDAGAPPPYDYTQKPQHMKLRHYYRSPFADPILAASFNHVIGQMTSHYFLFISRPMASKTVTLKKISTEQREPQSNSIPHTIMTNAKPLKQVTAREEHQGNKSAVTRDTLSLRKVSGGFLSNYPVEFTKDSNYFFCCTSDCIKIYSVATGEVVRTLSSSPDEGGHSDMVTCVMLNPNNALQLFSSSLDGTIKLWDFNDSVLLKVSLRSGMEDEAR